MSKPSPQEQFLFEPQLTGKKVDRAEMWQVGQHKFRVKVGMVMVEVVEQNSQASFQAGRKLRPWSFPVPKENIKYGIRKAILEKLNARESKTTT